MTTPHNPANVTPSEGYRLLDEDEVGVKFYKAIPEIVRWNGTRWDDISPTDGFGGSCLWLTYATRLSRSALRAARGLEPEPERKDGDEKCFAHTESYGRNVQLAPTDSILAIPSNAAASSNPKLAATPRTLAAVKRDEEGNIIVWDDDDLIVGASVARTLERETISLRAELLADRERLDWLEAHPEEMQATETMGIIDGKVAHWSIGIAAWFPSLRSAIDSAHQPESKP